MFDVFHQHHSVGDDTVHHDNATTAHDASVIPDVTGHVGLDQHAILGSHGDVPWLHFGPQAAQHDTDHDGIPDSLDHAVGPGAEPQILGTHFDVPWLNFGPDVMHHDTDHDGVPDALDHHVGFGAQELPPGVMSSGVPWEQITQEAIHRDTDHDGIPDALDNRVGPGAE